MLLVDIAEFLLHTVAVILGVTLLSRVYMSYLGMPARNPLTQFAIALTDWLVRPLRRLLPAAGRFDAATLLAALLVLGILEMGAVLMLLAELGFLNIFLGGGYRVMIAETGQMQPVIA